MPCAGGPGSHQADYLRALEAWVELSQAPDQIIGKGGKFSRRQQCARRPKIYKFAATACRILRNHWLPGSSVWCVGQCSISFIVGNAIGGGSKRKGR